MALFSNLNEFFTFFVFVFSCYIAIFCFQFNNLIKKNSIYAKWTIYKYVW